MPAPLFDTGDILNSGLSAALQVARRNPTPTTVAAFYEALLNSTLVLPVPEDLMPSSTAEPQYETDDEEPIPLVTFEDDAGETVLVAFTDEDAAIAWEPEGMAYVGLRGLDLVLLAAEHAIASIVLNPGNDNTWRMSRADIATLAQGELPAHTVTAPEVGVAGTTVVIAPPTEAPPARWQMAVREILAGYPSIEAAYVFELHLAREGSRLAIGLELYREMTSEAQDRLVDTVLSDFAAHLPEDQTLEFVILDEPDLLQAVRDAVPALYTHPA